MPHVIRQASEPCLMLGHVLQCTVVLPTTIPNHGVGTFTQGGVMLDYFVGVFALTIIAVCVREAITRSRDPPG